jgi:PAS domain S-box-containing protein
MNKQLNTILYVDDEDSNLILFEEVFAKYFNVITTVSTKEAREFLKNENVKVLVTDLKMPIESGLDFIKSISPQYPDLIYIVLTAYSDVKTVLDVVNQGVIYRYLLKPWDKNEILLDLNNACNAYDLRAENIILLNELKHKNHMLEKTMVELQEREQQFFNIFNSSTDAILIISKKEQVLLANPMFYSILGYTGQESLQISDFLSGKQLMLFRERFGNIIESILPAHEYEVITKKGNKRIVEANSTKIEFFGEQAVLSILRDITDRRLISQHLFNTVVQAEENERRRIADDLHDGLSPNLSLLKKYVGRISDKSMPDNDEKLFELTSKTIDDAILQLNAISHNLSPHILEKSGLLAAIQDQLEMVRSSSNINFEINSNLKERLKREIEISLFRALKECINNTILHSGAQNIKLEIFKSNEFITIVFEDDGKGFDVNETISKSKGIGLYNIRNRVQSIGGELEIVSKPGKGCSIRMKINV